MSLNHVTFIANLTKAPETRTATSGATVARMRVAISRPRRNGEDQGADYVDVTTFGTTADNCARFLHKGSKVAVDGRLNHSEWDADDGRHQHLGVIANTVQFLDPVSATDTDHDDKQADAAATSTTA